VRLRHHHKYNDKQAPSPKERVLRKMKLKSSPKERI
jgi:hypothetical protein